MVDFSECLKTGKLVKIRIDNNMIRKEIENATLDLETAKDSLKQKKFKWAIIQAYYSMFHCARALIFQVGLREKSHRCLIEALREKYVKSGKMNIKLLDMFIDAMSLREEADYGYVYSEFGAEESIKYAEMFLNETRNLLR